MRSLIGHTARAAITEQTYLDRPAETVTVTTAAQYYALVSAQNTDPAAVTHRGREAGHALGEDPSRFVSDLVARVEAKLRRFDEGHALTTIVGGMLLGSA